MSHRWTNRISQSNCHSYRGHFASSCNLQLVSRSNSRGGKGEFVSEEKVFRTVKCILSIFEWINFTLPRIIDADSSDFIKNPFGLKAFRSIWISDSQSLPTVHFQSLWQSFNGLASFQCLDSNVLECWASWSRWNRRGEFVGSLKYTTRLCYRSTTVSSSKLFLLIDHPPFERLN